MVRCQKTHPMTIARSANPPTMAPAIPPVAPAERPDEEPLDPEDVVDVADVVDGELVLVNEVVDYTLAKLSKIDH